VIRQSLISLSLLIIVGWFLVVWDSPPESFIRKNADQLVQKRSVDSYMTGISSRRFSETGDELFLLTSSRMELFDRESRVELKAPRFVSVTPKAGSKDTGVSFAANSGTLFDDGRKLVLNGAVEAVIAGTKNDSIMTAETLNYDPSKMLITTDEKFNLTTPTLSISGKVLNANLSEETFIAKSRVIAVHEAS
jgi:LPS export ABC transporter protein LptC